MKKSYENRAIVTDRDEELSTYFFPKHNPPISIRAKSFKEAEEKFQALDNKKEND